MKSINALFFAVAVLLTPAANCQQQATAFDFRAVVQPGMTIGGHTFTEDTTIDSASLNEAGEVAYLCHWLEKNGPSGGVFTSHRLVASQGEIFDKGTNLTFLVILPEHSTVAINAEGSVAYVGEYAGKDADGANGIFVEKHLALGPLDFDPRFTLTDDGQVLLTREAIAKSAAQKGPGVMDRVHIKMPRLPNDVPLTISPAKRAPAKTASPALSQKSPFPVLAANHSGQEVILVKHGSGFLLLLATPKH